MSNFMYNVAMRCKFLYLVIISVVFVSVFSGCKSTSPYVYMDSWAVRDNAVPQYFNDFDIIYFYPELGDWQDHRVALAIHDHVVQKLEPFGNKARVFAPFLHADTAAKDMREALEYYLDKYHDEERPFIVIAEGEGAKTLTMAMPKLGGVLDEDKGFTWAFVETEGELKVDKEFVEVARGRVRNRIHSMRWGRKSEGDSNAGN